MLTLNDINEEISIKSVINRNNETKLFCINISMCKWMMIVIFYRATNGSEGQICGMETVHPFSL